MTNPAPDFELVRLARQGEPRAFDELMARYRLRSIRTAMTVLGNEDEAEDEVQNTWWKVFVHIDQYKEESLFTTWLTRITVNQCLMRIRQRRLHFHRSLDARLEPGHPAFDVPDPAPHPESAYLRRERHARVRTELRRIPKVMREIVTLCDMEGLSMKEAADTLGLSVSAVKSRLRRARTELRQRLLSLEQVSSLPS
jgi:RNA polymerase sigma-70 factor (ECF subfamily)